MSMALLVGFVAAYPMNWWLVAKGLKHGMLTVRSADAAPKASTPSHAVQESSTTSPNGEHTSQITTSSSEILWVTVLSIATFALAIGAVVLIESEM